jgi:hypothetical protein
MAVRIPARKAPAQIPEITVNNPGKGLNTLISENLINDAEASDLNNIQFVESGCISKSSGIQAVGTGLVANPHGLGVFYPTGLTKRLLTVDGTSLKYLNGSTWTAISGVSFTADKEVTFTQCNNALYIWNGDQAGAKLDSALTLTRPTTTISASFAIWYNGFQIASGVSTQPNRLYVSDGSTPDPSDFTNADPTGTGAYSVYNATTHPGSSTWGGTGANYIDVAVGDGDKITGLAKFQGVVIIFKERSIYQLSLAATTGLPTVTNISSGTGCVSHKSIDNVENDLFYLSRKGYYVLGNEPNFNTAVRTNELSSRVKPVIDTINMGEASNAASIFSDFKFYTTFATGGNSYNNQTLIYDRRYLAWTKVDYMTANSWAEFIDSTGAKHLYFADDNSAQVYEVIDGNYSIDGDAMSSQWTSKAFDANNFDYYKRWLDVTILFRQISGTVTVTFYADNNAEVKATSVSSNTDTSGSMGTVVIGSPIFGGTGTASSTSATNNVPYRFKINTKSRTLKIKISNSNNNENFIVLGFVIAYVPYNRQSWPSTLKIQ